MAVICLIAALFITSGAAAESPVRLHVIGETDWHDAQARKLQVRDWALEIIASGAEDPEEALNDRAEAAGLPRNISVETGVFPYPECKYSNAVLPAGDYAAIRVRIGRAEGRNWWGLIYPEQACCSENTAYYSVIVDWLLGFLGIE